MQYGPLAKEHAELFQKEGADAVRAALVKLKTYGSKNAEIDDEDIREVVKRLESGEVKADVKDNASAPAKTKKHAKAELNSDFDLSGFDYPNLRGDAWKKYQEIESQLVAGKRYVFAIYKAYPIKKDMYPGIPDSPKSIEGIVLVNDAPIRVVTVEAKHAMNLNAQLPNANMREACQYYLLAK